MAGWWGVSLALALPWSAGALWLRVLSPRPEPGHWPMVIGYGYVLGLIGVTLVLRLQAAVGLALNLYTSLVLAGLLAVAAGLWRYWQPRSQDATTEDSSSQKGPYWRRVMFGLLLLWLAMRLCGLFLEVRWQPLFPWDAWTTWGLRARVWTDLQALTPFRSPQDWLADVSGRSYTIDAWYYPVTVSLLATWPALAFGSWNESAANLPWAGCAIALGLGFYGQARLWGIRALESIVCVWLLMSLPLLDTHVALAGYADIWLASSLGFALMAFLQWLRTADRYQGALSLIFILICPLLKREGAVWAMLFVPALLIVKLRGYQILILLLVTVGIGGLIWGIGGVGIDMPGLGPLWIGSDRFQLPLIGEVHFAHQGSWEPVFRHLFLYSTWHLLSYLVVLTLAAAVIVRMRGCAEPWFQAGLIWVLTSLAALYVLFFWTDAYRWAINGVSINRIILQFVPALVFWIMILWLTPLPRDRARI